MSTILVAEDSFALANLLMFVLRNAGFEVDLHRTGASAYEAARYRAYDLILLDQQMPKMTGLEVIAALRNESLHASTPIFLCTAKSHEIGIEQAQQRWNIADVFHKPFSPKALVQVLKSAVQPQSSEAR